jgi:hypothetical protein
MTSASLLEVRELVLDSTKSFEEAVGIEDAEVVERVDADGSATLLIRLRAEPHQTGRNWTETRFRISQRIRDELLRVGDLRYPILAMYTEREWQDRDR